MPLQVLPESPSFGAQFARSLGGGFAQGVGKGVEAGTEFATKLGVEKAKQQEKRKLLESIMGLSSNESLGRPPSSMGNGLKDGGISSQESNPNEDFAKAVMLDNVQHGLGQLYLQDIEHKKKGYREERKFQTSQAEPFVKNMESLRERLPYKESATRLMENAIQSGNEGLSWDYLASLTGYEPLLSQEGAKLVAGTKEFLLGNIGRGGTRPNMWLEQQIATMAPKLGRSKAANMAVLDAIKHDEGIEKERLRLYDEITDKYEQQFGTGFKPADVAKQVDRQMRPFIDQQQEKLSYKLRKLQESEMNTSKMNSLKEVFKGTPLTTEKAAIIYQKAPGKTPEEKEKNAEKIAKKLGYKIYGPEIYGMDE